MWIVGIISTGIKAAPLVEAFDPKMLGGRIHLVPRKRVSSSSQLSICLGPSSLTCPAAAVIWSLLIFARFDYF
jgi:hypothetical protein